MTILQLVKLVGDKFTATETGTGSVTLSNYSGDKITDYNIEGIIAQDIVAVGGVNYAVPTGYKIYSSVKGTNNVIYTKSGTKCPAQRISDNTFGMYDFYTNTFITEAPYLITPVLSNVTAGSANPPTIAEGETVTLTFTANSGYILPDTVSVSGASSEWNKSTGTLTLSNPISNVSFTISGVAVATYNIIPTLTNITASASSPRSSDEMTGVNGESHTYYTQNPPVS